MRIQEGTSPVPRACVFSSGRNVPCTTRCDSNRIRSILSLLHGLGFQRNALCRWGETDIDKGILYSCTPNVGWEGVRDPLWAVSTPSLIFSGPGCPATSSQARDHPLPPKPSTWGKMAVAPTPAPKQKLLWVYKMAGVISCKKGGLFPTAVRVRSGSGEGRRHACVLFSYFQASEGMLPSPLKTVVVLFN